jgi:hypothetical protein
MGIRRLGSVLLVVVVSVGVGIGLFVTGIAQGRPYSSSGITVSPPSPAPGGMATVTGQGFKPGSTEAIQISTCSGRSCHHIDFRLIELGTGNANSDGVVTDEVTIPSRFAPGSIHVIEAKGRATDGKTLTESTTVRLSGQIGRSSPLPRTGRTHRK